jgi:hypothetical protein
MTVVPEAVPPLSVKGPMPRVPPLGPPISETSPVADAGVTLAATVTGWPCGILAKVYPVGGVRARVVVVVEKLTEFHLFTRFATLTEPSPVARS